VAELTLVTMVFDAARQDELAAVLANQQNGCRNIDLCASLTKPGRFVIVEKWATPEDQRAHFDSVEMIEMATSCEGLLQRPPDIDLLEGLSAHDLC